MAFGTEMSGEMSFLQNGQRDKKYTEGLPPPPDSSVQLHYFNLNLNVNYIIKMIFTMIIISYAMITIGLMMSSNKLYKHTISIHRR